MYTNQYIGETIQKLKEIADSAVNDNLGAPGISDTITFVNDLESFIAKSELEYNSGINANVKSIVSEASNVSISLDDVNDEIKDVWKSIEDDLDVSVKENLKDKYKNICDKMKELYYSYMDFVNSLRVESLKSLR